MVGLGTSVPHLDFRQPPVNRHVVDFASKKKKKILAVGSIEQGKLVSREEKNLLQPFT